MPSPMGSVHGLGVRTDVPPSRVTPRVDPTPKPKITAMTVTFEAAAKTHKLKDVSAAKAKSLEAKFKSGSAKTEDLSGGRLGVSLQGMVVNGELFVRSRVVRPYATPTWQSAGPLKKVPTPQTDGPTAPQPWGPRPKSVEARAQKTVADRMALLSNPSFALKASELAEVKQGIADGKFEVVNATPKGLLGVGYTGYVRDDMLIVEKKAVHPGAKSTFYLLGPLE